MHPKKNAVRKTLKQGTKRCEPEILIPEIIIPEMIPSLQKKIEQKKKIYSPLPSLQS